ncbi:malate dehydrogenase (decarboxylating) [Klebsormidium nitens]|uniref:Malic enzyme n=1 Tax=Klebsormidium nitens TaxID=105231 RepID=A0A1Y1IEQ2_KLENI|nr:malate dehydrogenase (decarboxylating) [Klebsormidium nitens]|eukprot:GAQ86598.1 malate dehydrogenase (decarboxylating) [Klebsormidium nitens]
MRGHQVLHDPWFNKGTAFSIPERDRLGLRGLLPPKVMTADQQVERFMRDFRKIPNDEERPMQQWRMLNRMHDRNETLYYKIVNANIKELAPIIYTPIVGQVCQNFSGLYRRPRGMYFSSEDKGEFSAMVWNWPGEEVDIIVVTDGSRILGLGDLGVQGIGVVIGKLDLYVAGAGINPRKVLPIVIDVGTNNKNLLDNDLYMGAHHERLEGPAYEEILDEFMEAVFSRWPNVIVQFEDFQNKWALKLLQKYRNTYRMFNDDVQGTACVGLAGILGAVRAMGRPMEDLASLKFVVVGAGSAGMGLVDMVRQNMAQALGGAQPAMAHALHNFWLVDKDGLITKDRKPLLPLYSAYARDPGENALPEGANLLKVIQEVKPDFLIGLSGCGGLFNKEILREMAKRDRPVIFPMSNPTSKAEATAEAVFKASDGRAIFASGSPFPDVVLDDGRVCHTNQGNNMYLFPGIGLGTMLCGARTISDGMLHAATERLAALVPDEVVKQGILYPPIEQIRSISVEIASAIVKKAVEEDLADGYFRGSLRIKPRQLGAMTEAGLKELIASQMWSPQYTPLIYTPKD